MPEKLVIKQGEKYGKLTIIEEVESVKRKRSRGFERYFLCKCDCDGNLDIYRLSSLRTGNTNSCGCYKLERIKETAKHGKSKTPLYTIWKAIKRRCYSKIGRSYKDYGSCGIYVCDEWLDDPELFMDWAMSNGYSKGLQIDRIDNDGPYSPENCHFVTSQENNCNQRLMREDNTSGYRGVCWVKKESSFSAQVDYKKERRLWKSGFRSAKEAAIYRDKFIIKNGIPLPLNFPEMNKC